MSDLNTANDILGTKIRKSQIRNNRVFMVFSSSGSDCWASQGPLVVKNLPANAGDAGSIPGSGRSLE